MTLDKSSWLEALRREGAAFRAVVTPEDLDKPVPSRPTWTVHKLVGHLGQLYKFHQQHLPQGTTNPPEQELKPVPTSDTVLQWWDEAFSEIVTTLEEIDPDTPAWNWSVQPQKAIFWHRRLAHETAIHRWDIQTALALPEPIDPPEFAADGMSEVLDSFLASHPPTQPIEITGAVRLAASDIDTTWDVRVRSNGIALLDTGGLFASKPEFAAIGSGTASDLLLSAWGRVPMSVLDIQGEKQLIEVLRIVPQ